MISHVDKGCSDQIRISIRNEGLSAVGMLPIGLSSRRPSGISLTEDSCLARVMPSSQVVTSNDCYKIPGLLPSFRMVLKGNPALELLNQLRLLLIPYHCPVIGLICSYFPFSSPSVDNSQISSFLHIYLPP